VFASEEEVEMKKILIILFVLFAGTSVQAELVDISIEPAVSTVNVGDSFDVGIWLRDDGLTNVTNVAVNFGWDENLLQFNGVSQGDYTWGSFVTHDLSSTGNPDYAIFAMHVPSTATTDFLFATVNFTALAQTPSTDITIYDAGLFATKVFIGASEVTGSFTDGSVTIVPEPATMCILGLGGLVALRKRKIS